MREKWQKQIPLMSQITDHKQCKELEVISSIIDANSSICELVLQDLNKGKLVAYRQGANGMSADQVLRCAIVAKTSGLDGWSRTVPAVRHPDRLTGKLVDRPTDD